MQIFQVMFKRFFNSTPIPFPIIGIFLIIYSLYITIDTLSMQSTFWQFNLQILPLLIYTILWIGICFLNRNAMRSFIVFTVIMLLAFYLSPDNHFKKYVLSVLIEPLPINIALSFLILIFYQKIDLKSRESKNNMENETLLDSAAKDTN